MYDSGVKKEDMKPGTSLKRQFGTIVYKKETNYGVKGTRRIEAYLPLIGYGKEIDKPMSWLDEPDTKKEHIAFEYSKQLLFQKAMIKKEKILANNENDPLIMYFESMDASKMKFENDEEQPSKKNFQMVDKYDSSKIYLQFYRKDKTNFKMSVAYPFSLYQAFSMCLSTFDYKI